jgi:hypothetical protein
MIYIAHRGLTDGPDVNLENRPEQIEYALSEGFDCEIDLWVMNSELCLGHDRPDYLIDAKFLKKFGLWIHAKNLPALRWLTDTNFTYFWHEGDKFTLTSNNFIWTYPENELTDKSICVMPEWSDPEFTRLPKNCFGICSDYVRKIRDK